MTDRTSNEKTLLRDIYVELADAKTALDAKRHAGGDTLHAFFQLFGPRIRECLGCEDAAAVRAWKPDETTAESPAGVRCGHCGGTGKSQVCCADPDITDDGMQYCCNRPEECPCSTCSGTGRVLSAEQYIKTLPADWHVDSSLERWFPIAAEELQRSRAQLSQLHSECADLTATKFELQELLRQRAGESAVKSNEKPSASTDDHVTPSREPPPSSVECPKCRTQLAFEGDECGLCKEEES